MSFLLNSFLSPYLLRDTFTDANGTLLTAHAMDVGPGWTLHEGTCPTIQSNRASLAGDVGCVCSDAGRADVVARSTASVGTADANHVIAVVVRCMDGNNFWQAALFGNGFFAIYDRTGGTFTMHASTSLGALTVGVGYTIEVTASGASITATVNGGNQISYGSATFNQTVTHHGIRIFSGDATPNTHDDFEAVSA